jgi:cold shock CspA family protein
MNEQVKETNKVIEKKEGNKGKIFRVIEDGYFFILSEDIPFERIFCHWTSLRQDTLRFPELEEGMHVTFDAIKYEVKGWQAINVSVSEKE